MWGIARKDKDTEEEIKEEMKKSTTPEINIEDKKKEICNINEISFDALHQFFQEQQ